MSRRGLQENDDDDKQNRVDLLVKNTKGELILIEVQVETELDFFQRLGYGVAKLIVEFLDKGKPYSDIKKGIAIGIVYFSLGKGDDYA